MSRPFKFKAWNSTEQLLVRLNSIQCEKGRLYKTDHILLQFTGLLDKNETEVYEKDILLEGSQKLLIVWDSGSHAWAMIEEGNDSKLPVNKRRIAESVRLCNWFESQDNFPLLENE